MLSNHALISFLAFFLYMQLGLYVLLYNHTSKINRAFFFLCSCLIIWSFGSIFIYTSPNEQVYKFWERVSSLGWVFFPAFLALFFFTLKSRANYLFKHLTLLIFFLSAALFFTQSLLGNLLAGGYDYFNNQWYIRSNIQSIWYTLFILYLIASLAVSLFLLIKWSFEVKTIKEKKQSKILMTTLILFFFGILVGNYLIPIITQTNVAGYIHVISFIWVTGFGYAIVKYKFLVINPETAANEIISKMKELLFFLDNDGNILKVNQFTEDVLGFEGSEIVNKPFDFLIMDKSLAESKIAKLKEEEMAMSKEYFLKQKNGEVIPFNLTSAEVKDDAGDVLGTIVVGYDVRYQKLLEEEIELRKKTEKALKESEEQYRSLYSMVRLMCDNVPDLIWAKDLNRRFIFTNKTTCEKLLFAKDTQEPVGETEKFFFKREKKSMPENKKWFTYGDICVDSDSLTLRNRESGRYVEFGNIRGKFTYHDVHKAPFWDEFGNLIGIVGCSRDVTQEKRMEEEHRNAEKALASEKELLSVTLKSIGDGVISTDTQGRIILMNQVAEKITGWNKDEVWGKPVSNVLKLINYKTHEKIEDPVKQVLSTESIVGLQPDTALVTKEGRNVLISDSGAPIRNKEGEIIGVVIVFSDITNKHRMETELIKIQKLETVGVLAGGIAHDFNNILTAISGNISLSVLQLKDNPDIVRRLQEAEKACFRARDLTQQLLTFSKGGEPVKKLTALGKIIEDTTRFALRGSNVKSVLDISKNLGLVEVDESQICQVINNLVINAKQAMPDGGTISIVAKNVELNESNSIPLPSGQYISLLIQDEGSGIPMKFVDQIFDPFFTTKQTGSGLGLTSSYNIIKRHSGYITVLSKPDEGSLFTIYLPISDEKSLPEEELEEYTDYSDSGLVLVMDDDNFIRETLTEMLKKIGYSVIQSINGEEAVSEFVKAKEAGNEIKFIILDLTIPGGMGGKEAVKKLREIDPGLKAIVSSGYSTDPVLSHYDKFGFDSVMEKPYILSNLIAAIKGLEGNR